jgi:tRNA(Ile)-lysidine synthase
MSRLDHRTDIRDQFEATVRGNLDRLRGNAAGPGVVAVSGGADSVALLSAVAASQPTGGLVVAHLNHQLRGVDSDADAAFVARLLPELPHQIESIDVRAAAQRENLEATARRLRYDFLGRVSHSAGATWLATGHTRDDQAETVLHRLIRGTGLRGLRGIAAARELSPGVRLVRPLITVSRDEVIAYLRAVGQSWCEDETNRDTAFTRNRIRHELLPVLRSFNPVVVETLGRLAAQANEVFEDLEAAAAELLRIAERPRVGAICVLDRATFAGARPSLVRELLNLLWEREGWPRGDLTTGHFDRAISVIHGDASAWDFPGGVRILRSAHVVRVGPTS